MKSALVTGTSGYVGSRLAHRLERDGWKVFRLTREAYDVARDADGSTLKRIFEREKPNVVFHLASLFLAQHQSADIPKLVESNVLFGTRLLQVASELNGALNGELSDSRASAHHVIDFVTAGTAWQRFSKEDDSAVNLYAATKSAFHAIAKYYSSAFGVRVCELRLFDTYGPHDPRRKVVRILAEAALGSPRPLEFSPGDQMLHLVHVDDVVDAFLAAEAWLTEQRRSSFASFRVDAGQAISLKELASEIETVSGKKIAINWGGRTYRDREVMKPFSTLERVPGWAPKIALGAGLREILSSLGTAK